MSTTISNIKIKYTLESFDSKWEEITRDEISKVFMRNRNTIWSQIQIEGVDGRFDLGFSFGSKNPTLVIVEYDGEYHFKGPGMDSIRSKDITKQNAATSKGVFFVRIDYTQNRQGINSCLRNAMHNIRMYRKHGNVSNTYYSNYDMYNWIHSPPSSCVIN